ncbi:MAG: hypothetical protein FJX77_09055 [Armatimonadetes bacterium]|nr:hypothetical protein [Armatimonadota bacterium]
MTKLFTRRALLAVTSAALTVPALGQILPRDAATPLEVRRPEGEFAKRLHGLTMPTGKGWRAVMDKERLVQVFVPDRWKQVADPDGDSILKFVPPGQEKRAEAVFMVILTRPRDTDPLDVDEEFGSSYAEALAQQEEFKKLKFEVTDSGFVLARGMRFALAGGKMSPPRRKPIRQQQLIYIAEDRIVTLQFSAAEAEYEKYVADVARMFASYMTIGSRKEAP